MAKFKKIENYKDFIDYVLYRSEDENLTDEEIAAFKSGEMGYSDVSWDNNNTLNEFLIDAVTEYKIMSPSLATELFPGLYLEGLTSKIHRELRNVKIMAETNGLFKLNNAYEPDYSSGDPNSKEDYMTGDVELAYSSETTIQFNDDDSRYIFGQIHIKFQEGDVTAVSKIIYKDQAGNEFSEKGLWDRLDVKEPAEDKKQKFEILENKILDELIEILDITIVDNDGHTYVKGKLFEEQTYEFFSDDEKDPQENLRTSLHFSVIKGYQTTVEEFGDPIDVYCRYLRNYLSKEEISQVEKLLTKHYKIHLEQLKLKQPKLNKKISPPK